MEYDYICDDCEAEFNVQSDLKDTATHCPFCGGVVKDVREDVEDYDDEDWDDQDRDSF